MRKTARVDKEIQLILSKLIITETVHDHLVQAFGKGVTLHYTAYNYLRPQVKIQVNGPLGIFSIVNGQSTILH